MSEQNNNTTVLEDEVDLRPRNGDKFIPWAPPGCEEQAKKRPYTLPKFVTALRSRSEIASDMTDGDAEINQYFIEQIDPDYGDAANLMLNPFSEWHIIIDQIRGVERD